MKQDTGIFTTNKAPVALLIDGENLSPDQADCIVAAAETIGPRGVRRVYGDAVRVLRWRQQGTLQIVDSAQGKNAADMVLAIEAMELVLVNGVQSVAIASRDRDFSHLARKLAEFGVCVTGIGPADPDCPFRRACTDYREIGRPSEPPIVALEPPPTMDKLARQVVSVISQANGKCLSVMALGNLMKQRHKITTAQLPAANWRAYLNAHERFDIGEDQNVRLAKKKPPECGRPL